VCIKYNTAIHNLKNQGVDVITLRAVTNHVTKLEAEVERLTAENNIFTFMADDGVERWRDLKDRYTKSQAEVERLTSVAKFNWSEFKDMKVLHKEKMSATVARLLTELIHHKVSGECDDLEEWDGSLKDVPWLYRAINKLTDTEASDDKG